MRNLSLNCSYFLTQINKQSSTNRFWFIVMPYVTCNLFVYFSSMLNITSNNSLVDKLTLISNLSDWLVLHDKVCESNHINVLNSVEDKVYIVFFDMVKKEKKEENSKIFGGSDDKIVGDLLTVADSG